MKKDKMNELDYEQKTGDYSAERSKKFDWLVLIFCVLLAVVIWLFAMEANNPMIEKDIQIVCNFAGDGLPDLDPLLDRTVRVYGLKSVLENVNEIVITVQADDFDRDATYTAPIPYPTGVKPVNDKDKTVSITL